MISGIVTKSEFLHHQLKNLTFFSQDKTSKAENGILTSAQRKINCISLVDNQGAKPYAPKFDSQFEMDLFSSAKSYRRKSVFAQNGQTKENQPMLAKRVYQPPQDMSKVRKRVKTSPNRLDMMKDLKTMRKKSFILESKLTSKKLKFTSYQRRLFDLNTQKKELEGYSTYLESLIN